MTINREEFLQFVSYFGSDNDTIGFRCVHDKLKKYNLTMAEFGLSNSINLSYKKSDIESKMTIFDFYNQQGYAIHILPNLVHRKVDFKEITALPFDFDCGKENHEVKPGDEASFEDYCSKREDVSHFESKELSSKIVYTVYIKEENIVKNKRIFLEKHKEVLEYALINESPNGFRGIYFLKNAISYKESIYKSIQVGMIQTLGTDSAFMSPTQPLRSSGTYHHKKEPSLVQTIQYPKRKVTLTEIEKWFSVDYKKTKLAQPTKKKEKTPVSDVRIPNLKSPRPEEKGLITYEKALEEIKNRPFSDFFSEIDDNNLFSCLFHSDETPSANIYFSSYKCFACAHSGNPIQVWLDLYYEGKQEQLRAAVVDLMDQIGYEVEESKFYSSQLNKYKKNLNWLDEMDKNIDDKRTMMTLQYPTLYKKFFKDTIRYAKKDGQFVLNKDGEKEISVIYASNRMTFLKTLTIRAFANCRDVAFNGHAVFFVSQRQLVKEFLGIKKMEESKFSNYIKDVNQYLKQLELLGFIQTVHIDDVPEILSEKAKLLKKDEQNYINFYIMTNFKKNAALFEEKAIELSSNAYNNRSHTSSRGLALHQGIEASKQIYKNTTDILIDWKPEEKAMIRFIQKEIETKGYVLLNDLHQTQIVYRGLKKNGKIGTCSINNKVKVELLPLLLHGTNGIINTMNLNYERSSQKLADRFGYVAKDYQNQRILY
jgi:hypothetical protein